MFSPSKYSDKKFQLELIALIELLVKVGTPESLDLAEKFGVYYLELEKKIKVYDYSKEDEFYYS
jgi:hypothetical protein